MFITFDPEMAKVSGLPVERLYFLLISLVTLTVVISIKVVGIVLVSALLVTPAAAAYQWSEDFRKMMAVAIAFSLIATVGGLFLSYWLDTASGATIVLLSTCLFFGAAILSPRRRTRKRGLAPA
jgi:ABC-type Mn2+/Zn2+ transport system permease subunit